MNIKYNIILLDIYDYEEVSEGKFEFTHDAKWRQWN